MERSNEGLIAFAALFLLAIVLLMIHSGHRLREPAPAPNVHPVPYPIPVRPLG